MISEFILINVKANYTIEASFLFYSNAGYCSYLCSLRFTIPRMVIFEKPFL
jgi:hypothetical protein